MLVRELIAELEKMDGDVQVRIAEQPSWPFENAITSVVECSAGALKYACRLPEGDERVDGEGWYLLEDGVGPDAMPEVTDGPFESQSEAEAAMTDGDVNEPMVYLVEGSQIGYLPGWARKQIGW